MCLLAGCFPTSISRGSQEESQEDASVAFLESGYSLESRRDKGRYIVRVPLCWWYFYVSPSFSLSSTLSVWGCSPSSQDAMLSLSHTQELSVSIQRSIDYPLVELRLNLIEAIDTSHFFWTSVTDSPWSVNENSNSHFICNRGAWNYN